MLVSHCIQSWPCFQRFSVTSRITHNSIIEHIYGTNIEPLFACLLNNHCVSFEHKL